MAESQNNQENVSLFMGIWGFYNGDEKYLNWVGERHNESGLESGKDESNEYFIFLSINDWLQTKSYFWESYETYGQQSAFISELIGRYIIDTKEEVIDNFIKTLTVDDDDDW
jgi:hypothetical protein